MLNFRNFFNHITPIKRFLSLQAGRRFSDILMCQAEPNGSVVANVKDMFLAGGSLTPMFDSSAVS